MMRVILCAMAVVVSCLGSWAQPAEMVTNGSFEAITDDGLPRGWKLTPEGAGAIQTGEAPDGERWLHMVKPEGASHTLAYQRLTVKPGTGYRLRAWLRAPTASYYSLIAYDAVMNTLASKSTGWAVLGDWVELALDFRTRETDTVMSVGLLAYGVEADWDGVRMWEDDSVRIGDVTPAVNERTRPTEVERERGFMVFGRKANDFVAARYAPTRWDCHTPIRGWCPPGEFETPARPDRRAGRGQDVRGRTPRARHAAADRRRTAADRLRPPGAELAGLRALPAAAAAAA